VLRGYQISGYSNSGRPVDWKLFRVAEMSNLSITSEYFDGIRPFYNPRDKAMSKICCHV